MAEKETLVQKFAINHFTNTPAHLLRSVEMGKALCRVFLPGEEIPENPATLLNITRDALIGNKYNISDDDFVRMMLNQIDNDPSLVTFDMVADLVESDAYRKFNQTQEDLLLKTRFENWLVNESMLANINMFNPVEVVINQNGLKRTLAAVNSGSLIKHAERANQIDVKLKEFDEIYIKHAPQNAFKRLEEIAKSNQDYITKIKNVYNVLCEKDIAGILSENIDATTVGAENSQTRNAMAVGTGLYVNKVLAAVAQRKGWNEAKFNQIYIKTPIEQRAEKIQHAAEKINEQSLHGEQQKEPVQKETSKEQVVNVVGTNTAKVNPVFDVVKTFGLTLGGATAMSAISSIPGVGSVVGPVLGLTTVVTAGVGACINNYRQAKIEAKARGEELDKSDALKIALKTGIAMMGKAAPYAMAMALGAKYRAIGAGLVMARTMFNDLERRANMQQQTINQLEAKQGKSKNIFDTIKNIITAAKEKRLKLSDFGKSFAYGAAKGAAVFVGGQMGREVGSAIGSNVSVDLKHGVTWNTDKMKDDLSETKLGKLAGMFNRGHEVADNVPLATAGASVQLSDENLARLQQIGRVELTDNARATAYVENHRQYIGGEQHDWYNAQQEQMAVQTLQKAGVDDPYGVLRKVGSASRFFGGEYKATLDNLCNGKISDQDVNQIFGALSQINEQGGLGRINTMTTNFIDTHAQVTNVTEPVAENTTDFIHHDFEGTPVENNTEPTKFVNVEQVVTTQHEPEPVDVVEQVVEEDPSVTDFIHHDFEGGATGSGATPFISAHYEEVNDNNNGIVVDFDDEDTLETFKSIQVENADTVESNLSNHTVGSAEELVHTDTEISDAKAFNSLPESQQRELIGIKAKAIVAQENGDSVAHDNFEKEYATKFNEYVAEDQRLDYISEQANIGGTHENVERSIWESKFNTDIPDKNGEMKPWYDTDEKRAEAAKNFIDKYGEDMGMNENDVHQYVRRGGSLKMEVPNASEQDYVNPSFNYRTALDNAVAQERGANVQNENLNTERATTSFPFGHHDIDVEPEVEVESVNESVDAAPDLKVKLSNFTNQSILKTGVNYNLDNEKDF